MRLKKRFIVRLVAIVWILSFGSVSIFAQEKATLHKITEGIFHVQNVRGGNIVASIGEDGVLLVDSGTNPEDVERIQTCIAELTDKPIRYVVNTHWHSDHTAGNEKLKQAGAEIIAHENVAKRLKTDQFMAFFDSNAPASAKDAWPTKTFTNEMKLDFNGNEIKIFHLQPGHTDGDGIVYFKNANVIHVGDLFFNGYYPYIGISSGGSVNDMIAVINQILHKIDDATVVIPGHGPLSNKAELNTYVNMLTAIRDKVAPQVHAGKSLEEIQAAKPTKEFDADWGQIWLKGDDFVRLLYMDLSRKGDS